MVSTVSALSVNMFQRNYQLSVNSSDAQLSASTSSYVTPQGPYLNPNQSNLPVIIPENATTATGQQQIVSLQTQTQIQQSASGTGTQLSSQLLDQHFYQKPGLRFRPAPSKEEMLMQDGPGRRLRKNVANVRKHIDYVANALNHVNARLWQYTKRDRIAVQPDILFHNTVLPPASTKDMPVDCVLTKFVRAAMNKIKCPVYTLCWTPEGKRVITGASSGEFTLWNGTAFNFETILQAHDVAIRAIKWSHNDQWMASADHDGFVKYWQPNMNNVHMFQAHKDEPIRSISFCPTDLKFATASDDATARIWDFARCAEERVLRGHGGDVRSVDWHPIKGLLATGSRDSQQPVKLWDPRSGQCLATLHDHKNSVMSVQWNNNGNWLLSGSRDHQIKLYDIRIMKEVQTFRGHRKEVTALAWHPIHEGLFVSGGGDGSLGYWMVNTEKELALLEQAHDQAIWTLEWHPLGHILATGSNDNNTKFWARNRPGDTQEDIFGLTALTAIPTGVLTSTAPFPASSAASEAAKHEVDESSEETQKSMAIPGMGLGENIIGEINRDISTIPALAGSSIASSFLEEPQTDDGMKSMTMFKQPPAKKAQRQFERMWMISRPSATDADNEENTDHFDGMDVDGSLSINKKPKASLLGPPQSLLSFPPNQGAPPRMPSMLTQNTSWRQPNSTIGESWKTGSTTDNCMNDQRISEEDVDMRVGSESITNDMDFRGPPPGPPRPPPMMHPDFGPGRGGFFPAPPMHSQGVIPPPWVQRAGPPIRGGARFFGQQAPPQLPQQQAPPQATRGNRRAMAPQRVMTNRGTRGRGGRGRGYQN